MSNGWLDAEEESRMNLASVIISAIAVVFVAAVVATGVVGAVMMVFALFGVS